MFSIIYVTILTLMYRRVRTMYMKGDTVAPRNTGRQGTTKSHLLLADFCYCQYRNLKKNCLKGPRLGIRYWRISVTLGSGIARFNCTYSIWNILHWLLVLEKYYQDGKNQPQSPLRKHTPDVKPKHFEKNQNPFAIVYRAWWYTNTTTIKWGSQPHQTVISATLTLDKYSKVQLNPTIVHFKGLVKTNVPKFFFADI